MAPGAPLRWFPSLRSPVSQSMVKLEGPGKPLVGLKDLVREQIKSLKGLVLKFLEVIKCGMVAGGRIQWGCSWRSHSNFSELREQTFFFAF